MRIDVHAHHTPGWYLGALLDAGGAEELSILTAMGMLPPPDGEARLSAASPADPAAGAIHPGTSEAASAEAATTTVGAASAEREAAVRRRIDDMDGAGVRLQVVSIGAVQPYLSDGDAAVRITRRLNDDYSALVAASGGRLAGFAALPLPHVAEAVEEADRVLRQGWALGFSIGASAQGIPVDDDHYAELWAALDHRSAVVHIHPGSQIAGVPGCTDLHLAPDFVSPAEIAVAAARLVTTGMLDRYPAIRWILATLGGSLPFLARRHDDGLRRTQPELYARIGGFLPHLRRFWVDSSVIEEPEAMRAAVATFGADRIVLGSDFGRPGATTADAVAYVTGSPHLTEDQRQAVLGTTAQHLLSARST